MLNARTVSIQLAALLALLWGSACATTQEGRARRSVERYLSARTLDEAAALLAPEYRLWFGERSGAGVDRAAAIDMLRWDYALQSYHRIDELTVPEDGVVVARVHEENDLSRQIGFPGWNAKATFTVNDRGLITSQIYVPDADQRDWRSYLDPALAWIGETYPDALPRIFPDGKLNRTPEAAREWVRLLRRWRQATAQPDVVWP